MRTSPEKARALRAKGGPLTRGKAGGPRLAPHEGLVDSLQIGALEYPAGVHAPPPRLGRFPPRVPGSRSPGPRGGPPRSSEHEGTVRPREEAATVRALSPRARASPTARSVHASRPGSGPWLARRHGPSERRGVRRPDRRGGRLRGGSPPRPDRRVRPLGGVAQRGGGGSGARAQAHRRDGGRSYQVRWIGPFGGGAGPHFRPPGRCRPLRSLGRDRLDRGAYTDPARGRLTVGAWTDTWLASKVDLRPTSFVRLEGIVATHLVPAFGTVPLARLGHAEVRAFVARLGASGLSP